MEGEWIRYSQESAAVVFVHGILSSGEKCWRNDKSEAYWPELVAADSALRSFGVYVFTYYTDSTSGGYRISDAADALKEQLRQDRVRECRHLFFVCHSMGGIVVRRYILMEQLDLVTASSQIGLFLVASPSLGSSYANWLAPLAKLVGHSQADPLQFKTSNAWLNDLDKDFLNLKESKALSLYGRELVEDKGVGFTQVVAPFSAARYFGEPIKVPQSDHFSIAKPKDEQAPQHRVLRHFLIDTLASMKAPSLRIDAPVALEELRKKRGDTTDRDMAFLRVAWKTRITWPRNLSAESAALAPLGEKWKAETKEKANKRADKLVGLELMQWRGPEVEITELGCALVAFDKQEKARREAAADET